MVDGIAAKAQGRLKPLVGGLAESRLLGVREVAAVLGRTEKAVRRMWEKGRLPNPVRLDSRLQWDSRDIVRLLDAGKDQFQMVG
jgi:predicted DNA-binding transcriptional regulator AlpA